MSVNSETNWDRVDALRDEDIDTTDNPLLDDRILARMRRRMPTEGAVVTVPVDSDVLAWFQLNGPDVETRMSVALRTYAEGQGMASKEAGVASTE